jgi:hypothetical protein
MAEIGWVDTETDLDTSWPDAINLDVETLGTLLQAAYEQCLAFLPHKRVDGALVPNVPTPVPSRYRMAQIMQARALWRSTKVESNNNMGSDDFPVTVFPMDWTVKNLLRPKKLGRIL